MDNVRFSYSMRGKMKGVVSVSTSCRNCERCMHRHGEGMKKKDFIQAINNGEVKSICELCYAVGTLKWNKNLREFLEHNSQILENQLLTREQLNAIGAEIAMSGTTMLRIESFGDISTVTQAINYIHMCEAVGLFDRDVRIAWWTKNYDILLKAWKEVDERTKEIVRKNTNIVLSSVFVGIEVSQKIVAKVEKELGMPVKVFTVDAKESERTNCGARSCLKCHRCYDKKDSTEYVYEVVK